MPNIVVPGGRARSVRSGRITDIDEALNSMQAVSLVECKSRARTFLEAGAGLKGGEGDEADPIEVDVVAKDLEDADGK